MWTKICVQKSSYPVMDNRIGALTRDRSSSREVGPLAGDG